MFSDHGLRQPRVVQWLWLAGPVAILTLSFCMSTLDDRQVSLPGLGVLPETCTLHTRLGIDCPGCGLTRSFIQLANADFQSAWQLNPLGPLLFVFVVLQVPLAIAKLAESRWSLAQRLILQRLVNWNQLLLIGLLISLMVRWCVRLATGELT